MRGAPSGRSGRLSLRPDSGAVGLEEVRSAVAPRALTGVAVEDGVELSFRFEVADGKS